MSRIDDRSRNAPICAPRSWLRATMSRRWRWCSSALRSALSAFSRRCMVLKSSLITGRRHRGADRRLVAGLRRDGTAGRRLWQAALDLRRAPRPTPPATISRSLSEISHLLSCCVDLDRSAVKPRSNAAETRRWARDRGFKSLIVVTSNYHMPRAIVELSHAMPGVALISVRGGRRQMARRAVVDEWATLRLPAIGATVKYVAAEVAGAYWPMPVSN